MASYDYRCRTCDVRFEVREGYGRLVVGAYAHPAAASGWGIVVVSMQQQYAGHAAQVLALAAEGHLSSVSAPLSSLAAAWQQLCSRCETPKR